MKLIGKVFIVTGIFLLTFGLYLAWQRANPQRVAFKNSSITAQSEKYKPLRLIIRSQEIDLPVIEGVIDNQKWPITDDGIIAIGNVFYGHNWTNLLGNLVNVNPGEMIEIKYSDNKTQKYIVSITQVVNPDQKDVLNLADENSILIYTCTGFLDSKRFIVVAKKF